MSISAGKPRRPRGTLKNSPGFLLILCCLFVGCGGPSSGTAVPQAQVDEQPAAEIPAPAPQVPAPQVPAPQAAPAPPAAAPAAPDVPEAAAESEPAPQQAAPTNEVAAEPRAAADPVTAERRKLLRAINSGDAEVDATIVSLGEARTDESAAMLASLLPFSAGSLQEPSLPADASQRDIDRAQRDYQRSLDQARKQQAKYTPKLIAALAVNQTEPAVETLEQVIAGQIEPAETPTRIIPTAIEALLGLDGPRIDAYTLTALTEPATLLPTDLPNERDLKSLTDRLTKAAAQRVLRNTAPQLREQVATAIARGRLVQSERQALLNDLLQLQPYNIPAQVVLNQGATLEPRQSEQVAGNFQTASRYALNELIGLPHDAGEVSRPGRVRAPGSAPSQPVERGDWAQPVAALLWSGPLVQMASGQLSSMSDLTKGTDVISMATTVPVEAVREQLYARIQADALNVEDDSRLTFAGRLAAAIHDPAVLLAVKDAPRRQDPSLRESRLGREDDSRGGPQRRPARPDPRMEARTQREAPRYVWNNVAEKTVIQLCERLLQAAQQSPEQEAADQAAPQTEPNYQLQPGEPATEADAAINAPGQGVDSAADDVFGTATTAAVEQSLATQPVELHDESRVVARYSLRWPEDVAPWLAGTEIGPLVLHYVRLEDTSDLNRLYQHYSRAVPRSQNHFLDDSGRWIDLVTESAKPGWQQSIDVLVRRAENAPANPAPGADQITVDILVIEAPTAGTATQQ